MWNSPGWTWTGQQVSQISTSIKWELCRAIPVLWLACMVSVLWLTLGCKDSAKPYAASMVWTHLISEGSHNFHHLLDLNQNLIPHKHFEKSTKSKISFRLQEFMEKWGLWKDMQPNYAFYKMKLYKDMNIFMTVCLSRSFSWNISVMEYSPFMKKIIFGSQQSFLWVSFVLCSFHC